MTTENSGSGNKVRILIMDDEPHIRDIAKKILENLGYVATLTANGEEAIAEYRRALERESPYRLAIMDLTIPGGMGGKKAAQKILALDPGACLVISSGYLDDPVMTDPKAHGLKGIIPKPYRLAEFKETIQKLIPSPSAD